MSETQTTKFKKKLNGNVVSKSGDQTIVVDVARRFRHPKYKKFLTKNKKFHAHDANNEAQVGQRVTIIESRPHSKLKRWELLSVKN
jgi:small subunit ribosomal protein S17